MNGFSFLLLAFAAYFGWRALERFADKSESRRSRSEEIERARQVVELDPSNSGTRAQYAAFLIEEGDLEGGIHQFRTAISHSPRGPFTQAWKRQLKAALETQEMLAQGGSKADFNQWRTCRRCQATLALSDKKCPKCGETVQMGLSEWVKSEGVARDIWSQSWPIALVLSIAAIVLSSLPLEWQAALIISSLFVGFWLFLRSFNV